MQHQDHVHLLRKGVTGQGGVWADLGSGSGAFTLALADLLGPGGQIYSVDRDAGSLREQQRAMRAAFPAVNTTYLTADFTRRLDLPPLDGIVMANSLHFVRKKEPVLQLLHSYLRPSGRLLLVEYSADKGNMWVPYPLSFPSWQRLSEQNDFRDTQQIATVPSSWLREIYSALSFRRPIE
jgi:ubiquinone/menaquinone biosynthesis C-methylase UbiE